MLKKVITYVDYDGNERHEECFFNLSKTELIEMELSTEGGLEKKIQQITEAKDVSKIMGLFKSIILKAYGIKSPDGRRFIKSEELATEFSQTEAYETLFLELASNAEAASAFINGIMPADVTKDLNKQ